MFKNAEIDDRVWDIRHGWGTIVEIKTKCTKYPIVVKFDNVDVKMEYTFEGKYVDEHINPTLFWNEIKFNMPKKPEKIVKKFKIGDWVVLENVSDTDYCKGDILRIISINDDGFCEFENYPKMYHQNLLEKLKPEKDEWYWVYDETEKIPELRQYTGDRNLFYSQFINEKPEVKIEWKYWEPFFGELPSNLKNNKL